MALTDEQVVEIKKQLLAQIDKLPPEQAGDLRAQIEEASNEEIEEFLKAQSQARGGAEQSKCIFCEIIAGRIESVKIYEDPDIIVIMEIMPATKGHLLILPKQHFQSIQEIPDKILHKLFYFVKAVSPILTHLLDAKALSIYIPQGVLAGQRIQHFVINLVPRYEGDGVAFDWEHKKADIKDLQKIAEKIRNVTQTEVVRGIAEEQEKYEKKKKEVLGSEAEKIYKQVNKRIP
jgi:histidine triad (HIT) family protein